MFGGEGVIAENVRHEQRKVINYNHLVANMVILYNVQWMSRKLKELQEKRHPIDAEVLKSLSPYRREHINRFGDYLLDLLRPVLPLDPTIDFQFKSAAKPRCGGFLTNPGQPSIWPYVIAVQPLSGGARRG
jgi:hypothetical protein